MIPTVLASLARERARGHRRHRARTQRGHRARIEDGDGRAGRRVAEDDHAHHGRQAVVGIAGEGRDPLQHRQSVAACGHGAEVPVPGAVEVDLGRHRPRTRVVAQEGVARALDGLRRGDGGQHGVVGEDRDGGHEVASCRACPTAVPSCASSRLRRPPRRRRRSSPRSSASTGPGGSGGCGDGGTGGSGGSGGTGSGAVGKSLPTVTISLCPSRIVTGLLSTDAMAPSGSGSEIA